MLREHDRRLPLLVQPSQQADQLVAGDGVELRGGLVEQHQLRPARERRAERDALLLAAGELVRGAVEQRVDPERERDLLDPARDRRVALAAAFERERELGADGAHHELRLGVLEQHARVAAEVRGAVLARVEAGERDRAGERAAVEMRHEPAGRMQERRLAVAGQSRQQAELARFQLEADVVERRGLRTRVAVGDVVERQDHWSIPRRSRNGRRIAAISAAESTNVPVSICICTRG